MKGSDTRDSRDRFGLGLRLTFLTPPISPTGLETELTQTQQQQACHACTARASRTGLHHTKLYIAYSQQINIQGIIVLTEGLSSLLICITMAGLMISHLLGVERPLRASFDGGRQLEVEATSDISAAALHAQEHAEALMIAGGRKSWLQCLGLGQNVVVNHPDDHTTRSVINLI
eukprot:scaffold192538_cov19-Tisochrysis_lutea.AAC.1